MRPMYCVVGRVPFSILLSPMYQARARPSLMMIFVGWQEWLLLLRQERRNRARAEDILVGPHVDRSVTQVADERGSRIPCLFDLHTCRAFT